MKCLHALIALHCWYNAYGWIYDVLSWFGWLYEVYWGLEARGNNQRLKNSPCTSTTRLFAKVSGLSSSISNFTSKVCKIEGKRWLMVSLAIWFHLIVSLRCFDGFRACMSSIISVSLCSNRIWVDSWSLVSVYLLKVLKNYHACYLSNIFTSSQRIP